jgi:drug/metabolite transporter (DMT)-like permease
MSQATFLGYTLSGLNPYFGVNVSNTPLLPQEKKSSFIYIFLYALISVVANYFCNYGITLCGSGIFQVIHSSVVMNAAIISFLVRKSKLNLWQIVGIIFIVSGLASTAIPYFSETGKNVVLGTILSFLGTFLFSVSYVVDEYLIENYDHYKINSKDLSFKGGLMAFFMVSIAQIVFVYPNWGRATSTIVNWNHAIVVLILQLFADAVNNMAYYQAIYNVGAISTGVIQGIVSIGVFLSSHVLFCRIQAFQCISTFKIIATFMVISGVLIYSYGKHISMYSKELKELQAMPITHDHETIETNP